MLSIALKRIFKLMINSVYGRMMEHLRKRARVRLVINAKKYKKWVSRLSAVLQKIFSRNVATIHEIKLVLTLDKRIYARFSILNLNILLIYEFLYKYTVVKYGSDAKLLFTDAYSLVYQIKIDDVYEDFYEGRNSFDLSLLD